MKNHIFIVPAFVLTLLAPAVSARATAFEDLLQDSSGSEYTTALPVAVKNSAPLVGSGAGLDVMAGIDGDIIVLSKRQTPKGLKILPDDDVREDPPQYDEFLPLPDPSKVSDGVMAAKNIDPQNLIPADLRAVAQEYYLANRDSIANLRYVGVVDFAKHSSLARFYIADTADGTVRVYNVAHGSGSDPENDGYPTIFSNKERSLASSLGFYLTGDIYHGKHGRSMRLHGLSSTNSNAFKRAVVIHSAKYVVDEYVQAGRSWGCLAVSLASIDAVISTLKGGALIYAGLSGAK